MPQAPNTIALAPGTRVLVTAGASGIGRAIADLLLAHGARAHICDVSDDFLADFAKAWPDAGRSKADVSSEADVARMFADVSAKLGGLDVLVNNAGVYAAQPVTEGTYEQWQAAWQHTLTVNLTSAANATWCAVRHMIPAGGGRIINVSSRGAFRGEPDHPAYAASKAGLNALGQSLARALGQHGIAVSTVAPGFVDTDMAATILAGPGGDEIRGQSPFGRVATTGEVAAAVLYLASAGAEWASGAILDLNGASYLRT